MAEWQTNACFWNEKEEKNPQNVNIMNSYDILS